MYNKRRSDFDRAKKNAGKGSNQPFIKNYARERHTKIKVGEPVMLMDFLLQKMGGMSKTSV